MFAKTLFSFPGQGTQRAGMLGEIPGTEPWIKQAEEALGASLAEIDSEAALAHTRAVQLSLLIAGCACAHNLMEAGIKPDVVCGLSIGAFPAAVAARALRYEDAVRLVALRGTLMQDAFPSGYGMTAITGLSLTAVESLCKGRTDVYPANYNAEDQIVIAGKVPAMCEVVARALDMGAASCRRLKLSVPSHCPLLLEAAKKFEHAFAGVAFSRPKLLYLSASSARALWDPQKIKEDLIMNMARMTRWHEAMIAAAERGVRLAIEMPPGSVLTKLTVLAARDIEAAAADMKPAAEVAAWHTLRSSALQQRG